MLKTNEIRPAPGSNRGVRRVGRGQGSGKGCTAGKGYNGHKARSGTGTKPYFEGGQTPHTRRMPKRGFSSPSAGGSQIVNLRDLNDIETGGREITAELLYEMGLVHDAHLPVKVLGDGELTKPLVIRADSFSKSAKAKIEKAKGKAEVKAHA